MRPIITFFLLMCFLPLCAQESELSFRILEYGSRVSNLNTERAAVDIIVPMEDFKVQYQNYEFLPQELYNGSYKRVYVHDDRDAALTISIPGYHDLYMSVPQAQLKNGKVCKVQIVVPDLQKKQLLGGQLQVSASNVPFNTDDPGYNHCEIDVKTSFDLLYIPNDMPAILKQKTESGIQKFLVRIPRDGSDLYITFYIPGYYPLKEIVVNNRNFRPGTIYTMDVRIPKDMVTVSVDKEDFTNLWVDGVNLGVVSTVDVEKGVNHIFYTEYNGHKSRMRSEVLNSGRRYTLKLNMGTIAIKANPKYYESTITYGREKYVTTCLNPQDRVIGNYTVVVASPGYVSREFPVSIPYKGEHDVVRKCHLFKQVDNVRYAGIASSLKLNYGIMAGYFEDNRWGIVSDMRFSPMFFNSNIRMKDVKSTRMLSQVQYESSRNPGPVGFTFNVGPAFRFHEKAAAFFGLGYGQYSNIYQYDSNYYTPAKCRALNVEFGAMVILRNLYYNQWWNNIIPVVSFSRIMSKTAFADINFGLCYCF